MIQSHSTSEFSCEYINRGLNSVHSRRAKHRVEPPLGSSMTPSSSRIPRTVPIDWILPTVYNTLSVSDRLHYRNNGVALPPHHVLEGLSLEAIRELLVDRAAFLQRYEAEVLALYDIPTDLEMAQLRRRGM